MKEIINIFKSSPEFVYLAILGIYDWGDDESIEDVLGDEASRIIVETPRKECFGIRGLILTKIKTLATPSRTFAIENTRLLYEQRKQNSNVNKTFFLNKNLLLKQSSGENIFLYRKGGG